MVKRHYEIDFASGALVFPGGKAHDEDTDAAWDEFVDGNFDGDARAARIAAIREAFEESGILLARQKTARGIGATLISAAEVEPVEHLRGPIDRREESFLAMIRANDFVLALDCLMHFAHWVTPVMMPKRFDTHFFLAPAPPDQVASHDGRETTDTVWINPGAALDQAASGKAKIIFPTRMVTGKLAEAISVDDAKTKFENMKVVTVEPQLDKDDDGKPVLRIPAEAGYAATVEPLERLRKDVQ